MFTYRVDVKKHILAWFRSSCVKSRRPPMGFFGVILRVFARCFFATDFYMFCFVCLPSEPTQFFSELRFNTRRLFVSPTSTGNTSSQPQFMSPLFKSKHS